jgi:hypothetical protein
MVQYIHVQVLVCVDRGLAFNAPWKELAGNGSEADYAPQWKCYWMDSVWKRILRVLIHPSHRQQWILSALDAHQQWLKALQVVLTQIASLYLKQICL